MNRTYHARFTPGALCGVVLFALAALLCFWSRSAWGAAGGLVFALLCITGIEHAIHTQYTLTDDGMLHIDRGRFLGRREIPVSSIIGIRQMRGSLLTSRFVLIEYGAHKMMLLQPVNEQAFLNDLRKRMNDGAKTHKE